MWYSRERDHFKASSAYYCKRGRGLRYPYPSFGAIVTQHTIQAFLHFLKFLQKSFSKNMIIKLLISTPSCRFPLNLGTICSNSSMNKPNNTNIMKR